MYRRKLEKIPAPDYYVLYNGKEEMPDRTDLKLSDAFIVPNSGYEFTAHMININAPHNEELMKKCPVLRDYMTLVKYARNNKDRGMSNEEAVDRAVQRCISEGVLEEYLRKKRAEAVRMFLTEFDEEAWEKTIREESREEGIDIFITDKREDGVPEDKIREKLKKYYKLEDIEIDRYLNDEKKAEMV